jgi:hypothetical protein
VTATNAAGSALATSSETTTVSGAAAQPDPPANVSSPRMEGSAVVGQVLVADRGSWTGSEPISYAYQWQRCAAGGGYPSAVLADGPLAYWRFEETSGTQAADGSGNGRHGSYVGPTLGAAGAFAGSLAASFDGINDLVQVSGLPSSLPRVTVEAWVKSKTATWDDYGYIVSKRSAFILHPIQGARTIEFLAVIASQWQVARWTPPSGFEITQWHHYAGTYDGSALRLYVDGVARGSRTFAGSIASDNGPLVIGRDDGYPRYGNAYIDEVALYDKALTATRLLAHAQAVGAGGCADISGATGTSYTVAGADQGSTLRVRVTATNAAGSALATSSETTTVSAPP